MLSIMYQDECMWDEQNEIDGDEPYMGGEIS